jgi:hypothetical protein
MMRTCEVAIVGVIILYHYLNLFLNWPIIVHSCISSFFLKITFGGVIYTAEAKLFNHFNIPTNKKLQYI